jgi:hypothetical protein
MAVGGKTQFQDQFCPTTQHISEMNQIYFERPTYFCVRTNIWNPRRASKNKMLFERMEVHAATEKNLRIPATCMLELSHDAKQFAQKRIQRWYILNTTILLKGIT